MLFMLFRLVLAYLMRPCHSWMPPGLLRREQTRQPQVSATLQVGSHQEIEATGNGETMHTCSRKEISMLRAMDAPNRDPYKLRFDSEDCTIGRALECLPQNDTLQNIVRGSGCDFAFAYALRKKFRKQVTWDSNNRSCGYTPGKNIHYGVVGMWKYLSQSPQPRMFRFRAATSPWIDAGSFTYCKDMHVEGFDCFFLPADSDEDSVSVSERNLVQENLIEEPFVREALASMFKGANETDGTLNVLHFAQLVRILFHPSPAFLDYYTGQLRTVQHMVGAVGRSLAVHVRWGDACGEWRGEASSLDAIDVGGGRRCYHTTVYAEAIARIRDRFKVSDVFLATTSLDFLSDLKQNHSDLFGSLNWHYLDFDHTAMHEGQGPKTFDGPQGDFESRGLEQTQKIGPGAWADIWHLSSGDIILGSMASHFTRSAWHLAMGRHGHLVPWISLDGRTPCCDIGEQCSNVSTRTVGECLSWSSEGSC